MNNHRYSFSFIISTIVFTLVGFSFFLLAQKIDKPKKLTPKVIKIAIVTPIIKEKVIEKKTLPPQPIITPPIPIPPKIKKKVIPKKIKPKRVIKKKIIKKKIVKKKIIRKPKRKKRIKKKIIKKRVVKKPRAKKVIKKKITKKRVIHKKVVKAKKIKKKVIQRVEPIIEEVYIPTPPPREIVAIEPIVKPPVHIKPATVPQPKVKVDKSAEKREFLSQVRGKIIANKKYPKMALRRHIQGAVKVKFDITSSGNVSNIQFLNGKTILQKSVRKAVENSFPINIPNNLRSELPIHDIYITIHFNIN